MLFTYPYGVSRNLLRCPAMLERARNRRLLNNAPCAAFNVVGQSGGFFTAGRALLRPGDTFDGPAVVEQYDATTYVAPPWSARVDGFGNLVLEHAR